MADLVEPAARQGDLPRGLDDRAKLHGESLAGRRADGKRGLRPISRPAWSVVEQALQQLLGGITGGASGAALAAAGLAAGALAARATFVA
jgi:hypothetical protein